MSGQLVLVGTPIGNLSDFSPRAVEALNSCDCIAAEDTRVTLRLLNHFGIKKPLISYYEHNKRHRGEQICQRIQAGETIALVSDAGMPAISDPGEELVAMCHERGIPVKVVPGPSAVITALAVSGLPCGRFAFEGFLSMNKRNRREHLAQLKGETRTMVFYEAPHKLPSTLEDLLDALGNRRIAIVRELTKVYEEVIRTDLQQAAERFRQQTPKGEFVLVVEGASEQPAEVDPEQSLAEAVKKAEQYRQEGLSASEAAKRAAAEFGEKKGAIYRQLMME